jgi:hypothetical protein
MLLEAFIEKNEPTTDCNQKFAAGSELIFRNEKFSARSRRPGTRAEGVGLRSAKRLQRKKEIGRSRTVCTAHN